MLASDMDNEYIREEVAGMQDNFQTINKNFTDKEMLELHRQACADGSLSMWAYFKDFFCLALLWMLFAYYWVESHYWIFWVSIFILCVSFLRFTCIPTKRWRWIEAEMRRRRLLQE
jgi:hypothetical protein